jgi:hypothetical protein
MKNTDLSLFCSFGMRSHVATDRKKNGLHCLCSVGSVLGYLTTGKVGFPMTLSIYFCSQSSPFDSQPNPRKPWKVFLFFHNFSRHMQNSCIPVGHSHTYSYPDVPKSVLLLRFWRIRVRISVGGHFLLPRPALDPTMPPRHWVPEFFPWG